VAIFIVLVLVLVGVVVSQRKSRRRFWTTFVLGSALLGALAVYGFPHCVASEKLSRIHQGMTRDEVVRLLGPPVSVRRCSGRRTEIGYGKPARYCSVDVFLDSTGQVTGVFHDH